MKLKIVTWNANHRISIYNSLKTLLDEWNADVILLQDLQNPRKELLDSEPFSNYKTYYCKSFLKRDWGNAVIINEKLINGKVENDFRLFGVKSDNKTSI